MLVTVSVGRASNGTLMANSVGAMLRINISSRLCYSMEDRHPVIIGRRCRVVWLLCFPFCRINSGCGCGKIWRGMLFFNTDLIKYIGNMVCRLNVIKTQF